jgi:hypothetical protein
MTDRELIEQLLSDPDKLLQTRPFYRGIVESKRTPPRTSPVAVVDLTGTVRATTPVVKRNTVCQEQFARELDPYSHKVLFDENVPAITIKTQNGGWLEIEQYRMAIPFQRLILNKQVRHLCVNPMVQTLINANANDKQNADFVSIKQGWAEKNMEGAKTQFVENQKSYGNAALLFYMEDNKVHVRNICFADGYTIITHKNDNGKHILECLYYCIDDVEYIDCYDDTYMTRLTNETFTDEKGVETSSWRRYPSVPHGFSENPLIVKRGEVAWNNGQSIIESYEVLYNTFIVVQKRHGWGIIYIKGQFQETGKKIAGNVVLVDNSGNPENDAKILNAPDPNNMIETLKAMKQSIEIATGTTFILPEDINISSDISGLAVELTQELDMATAQDGVIEWQNVANKMMRLFVEGYAKELVQRGDNATAVTDFAKLRIHNAFQVWKPKSEEAHNVMVEAAVGAGIISKQTAVEKNTLSTPDELLRIKKEKEEEERKAAEQAQQQQTIETTNQNKTSTSVVDITE